MDIEVLERLKTEASELSNKLDKLNKFISSDKFENELNEENKVLLIMQSHAMQTYADVLERRIDING